MSGLEDEMFFAVDEGGFGAGVAPPEEKDEVGAGFV